jgi:hypothetical protein
MDKRFLAVFALFFLFVGMSGADASDALVRVSPSFLNTVQCESMMGSIYIESDTGKTYDIEITGVPDDWLEYPEKVYVEGKETVNYIINPSEAGTYRLTFYVETDGFDFEEDVKLWVSMKETGDLGPEEDDALEGGLTGMFVLSEENQALFIYALVAMGAAVAILLGFMMLKHEDEWENAR